MKLYLPLLFFIFTGMAMAQSKFTVSGYVKDASSGEGLIGAGIYVQELKTGTTTNVYGFYSITLPKGQNYTIVYSFLGYKSITEQISSDKNITKNIELPVLNLEIEEVVISGARAEREANVKSMQMSVAKMDIKTIKSVPALFGEVDLVRAIQLLPGVSTVGEGAQGFNVRGGSIDHNLILMDEAPVYNSSHLLGFFSVFNPDAVKDVKLYKGGVPAAYGGRLASLLDVRLKEGNMKKYEVSGGIGTIMTRLTVEGPIAKDKASFIVSGRRSYIDVLARPFLKNNFNNSQIYFYDMSTKVNYRINDNNTLFASGYFGRDVLRFGEFFQFGWGNRTGTLRWNHIFNQKLFANFTILGSNYDYNLGVPSGPAEFDWVSNIISYAGKADFNYYLNTNNTLTFGASWTEFTFKPGKVTGGGSSIFDNFQLPNQRAAEHGIYISNEQNITQRLSLLYGVRLSNFNYLGNKEVVYTYKDTLTGRRKIPVDPDFSFVGEYRSQVMYPNLEPRFSIKYELDENSSIKANYNRMAQYIHLISNTTAAAPTDVWTPSTRNIKPQLADQVALGYFRNIGVEKDIETSAEVFYKDMQNQIDYIDGASLLLNEKLEGELLNGRGRAYGLELYVKKNTGKLNGWISYTLSRTERQIAGINQGRWFVSRFDRTHNFVTVVSYNLNKKWDFSSTFNYGTGTPNTFPNSRIETGGLVYAYLADDARNNVRIPPYNRLDFAVTLKPLKNESRKFKEEWVFSLYNVYMRRNPFTVFFTQVEETDPDGGNFTNPTFRTEARRISFIGSIIPAVTYNFKF
jgi:hypothetical protein